MMGYLTAGLKKAALAFALVFALETLAHADELSALQTLADQGHASAQFALGTIYFDGLRVKRDVPKALAWWQRAANRGSLDAQFALGNIYSGGYGVRRDRILAYTWFDIAASKSSDDWFRIIAGSNRDAVAANMTPAEIADAKALVANRSN
jgi:TPR repeat protein